ncbi:MAG: hypothetical protein Q8Q39_03500 [bacterium]|nr:hypothetical protein [bacterium]
MNKKDLLIIPISLVFAALMLLPHLLMVRSLGADYGGIRHFVDDDAAYYVARVQDVLDGHWFLGNPYLAEHKAKPSMQFFFPDWIAALPSWLFGVGAPAGVFWSTLFWIPVLASLAYAGMRILTGSRFWAYAGTIGLLAGPFLRYWNRPVSPQTMLPFWFLFFIVMALWMRRLANASDNGNERAGWYPVLAMTAFGSLFYVYPYGWTFFTIVLCLLMAASIVRIFPMRPKAILMVLVGGCLLGSFYFLTIFKAAGLPEYGQSLTRLGLIDTHFPSGIRIVVPAITLLAVYGFALWKRWMPWNAATAFVVSGFFGLVIAVNQHIITGKNLEFSSHYIDTSRIWTMIGAAYFFAAWEARVRSVRTFRIIAVVVMIAIFMPMARNIMRQTVSGVSGTVHLQRYSQVLDTLKDRVMPDQVVFAGDELSLLIPMYTSANIYYDRHANLFFISDHEVEERFLAQHYFDNIDEKFLKMYERSIWGVRYIDQAGHIRQRNKLFSLFGLEPLPVPDVPQEEIDRMLARSAGVKAVDFGDAVKQYRADWLVWDTVRDPHWQGIEAMPFLELATTVGDFRIYRVKLAPTE